MARNRNKKTCKFIVIALVAIAVIAVVLGLIFGIALRSNGVELQVWPRGDDGGKEPLISYKSNDPNSYLPWARRMNETLKVYHKTRAGKPSTKNVVQCNDSTVLEENQVCEVPLDILYPCTAANNYNYDKPAPCVFLKLDKISGWTPQPYNYNDMPADFPMELQLVLKEKTGVEQNKVWVSCEGESSNDTTNMGPKKYIKYLPEHGFDDFYFRNNNQENFLSPLIAVLFQRPKRGVVITVVCKAWAKNIAKEGNEPTAVARFQLKVD